jgi:photosystem II stability/assembly factor-like uncharacterized protein
VAKEEVKMKKITTFAGAIPVIMVIAVNVFAQTWTQQTSPITTSLVSVSAVSRQVCWMTGLSGGVVKTTNGGTTWTQANSGLAGLNFYCLFARNASECWLGQDDGKLWHTTNGGASWSVDTLIPTAIFINVIHFFDSNTGFIQGDPALGQWRYYITTNGGANWTLPPNTPNSAGQEAGWNNSYCALDTGHIWWGTNSTKIWKGGLRGQFTSSQTSGLNSFGVWFNDPGTGFAIMTAASPYPTTAMNKSVNGGVNWTATGYLPGGTTNYGVRGIPGTGYIWICTTNGIYRSTDNGSTFSSQYSSTSAVYHLDFVDLGRGWACRANGTILIYDDPNFAGVHNGNNQLPGDYKLEQNYPNPFNPSTSIKYSLPKFSYVTLKIYDVLGNEIMSIVNEYKHAGSYSVSVDASSLSTGVYFYKLQAENYSDTKKMTLLK